MCVVLAACDRPETPNGFFTDFITLINNARPNVPILCSHSGLQKLSDGNDQVRRYHFRLQYGSSGLILFCNDKSCARRHYVAAFTKKQLFTVLSRFFGIFLYLIAKFPVVIYIKDIPLLRPISTFSKTVLVSACQPVTVSGWTFAIVHNRQNIFLTHWYFVTRQLSYRKDDRAMRPIYGCHEKFREFSLRTRLLFPKFVMGFCSDRY